MRRDTRVPSVISSRADDAQTRIGHGAAGPVAGEVDDDQQRDRAEDGEQRCLSATDRETDRPRRSGSPARPGRPGAARRTPGRGSRCGPVADATARVTSCPVPIIRAQRRTAQNRARRGAAGRSRPARRCRVAASTVRSPPAGRAPSSANSWACRSSPRISSAESRSTSNRCAVDVLLDHPHLRVDRTPGRGWRPRRRAADDRPTVDDRVDALAGVRFGTRSSVHLPSGEPAQPVARPVRVV